MALFTGQLTSSRHTSSRDAHTSPRPQLNVSLRPAYRLHVSRRASGEIRFARRRLHLTSTRGTATNEAEKYWRWHFAQIALLDHRREVRETDVKRLRGRMSSYDIRAGWGGVCRPSIFTSRAKNSIRDYGGITRRDYDKRGIVFTGTAPGSTPQSIAGFARYSAEIAERFFDRITSRFSSCEWFFVWEWQGRGALHMHAAFLLNDEQRLEELGECLHEQWRETLEGVADRASVDLFARQKGGSWRGDKRFPITHQERFKKDPSRYFSKYMSKEHDKSQAKIADRRRNNHYPSAWWGACRTLRAKARDEQHFVMSAPLTEAESRDVFMVAAAQACARSEKVFTYCGKVFWSDRTFVCYASEEQRDTIWQELKTAVERWRLPYSPPVVPDFARQDIELKPRGQPWY